jgi:DNA-binding MarR family transcriptional regulator
VTRELTDATDSAFRSLVRTWGLFRGRMEPFFVQFGISGAQWGVLRQLHRAESEGLKGLTLSDLGSRLLVKPPSVTNIVDRVERMGLVTRSRIPGDQRTRQVTLTAAGRKLVVRVLKKRPAQVRAILAGLNAVEHRTLYRLMEKLGAHLEQFEGGSSTGTSNGFNPHRRQQR